MAKENKEVEQASADAQPEMKKKGITRRQMIAVTAAGAALALPGISVVYRWANTKKLEIVLEGPFKDYGYFKPETLGVKDSGDFKIIRVKLNKGKYNDSVFVRFTFQGKEEPDRVMDVTLSAYDKEGACVAKSQEVFHDPRITGKKLAKDFKFKSKSPVPSLETSADLDLPETVRLSDIAYLRLDVVESKCNS